MNSVMEQVRRTCGPQLTAYESCVEANEGSWETSCASLKGDLSKCASKNVAILQAALAQCDSQVKAYNTCLEKNAREPYKCQAALNTLADCTDGVANKTKR